jgi:hypothetical protein
MGGRARSARRSCYWVDPTHADAFRHRLAFPILGLAAGQGFNHLAGKLVGFGGKLEGSRRSTPESQLSVLACWRAFKPWPARGLALADGLVVDLEGLQDLGFADSGACPAHRQGDAPSLLPSPANNIDFNSMASGAAVPRSVCPATGKRKRIGAVVTFAKQFHQFSSRRFAV